MSFFFDHYPYTNFHNVNLDWVLEAVKAWGSQVDNLGRQFTNLQEVWETFKTETNQMLEEEIASFNDAYESDKSQLELQYQQFTTYVTNYLNNLDYETVIREHIETMASNGELRVVIAPTVANAVSEWLEENITPTTPVIDTTLTVSGAGADAKVTGDYARRHENQIEYLLRESTPLTLLFIQGSINSDNGRPNPNYNNRIKSNMFPLGVDGCKIYFDSDFQYSIFFYSGSEYKTSLYLGSSGFLSGCHFLDGYDITIPTNTSYITIVVRYSNSPSAAIAPNDLTENDYSVLTFTNYEHFTKEDKIKLNEIEKPVIQSIQPTIIYSCREGQVDSNAYPHNSKWAIKATAHNEYDRIRFTVRRVPNTANENETNFTFVCIHDNYINALARNSDGTAISEQISSDSPLTVLDSYDWGIQYGEHYRGYKVPRLEEALYYSNMYGLSVTIEFNTILEDENSIKECFDLCTKYNQIDNLMVATRSLVGARIWQGLNRNISFYYGFHEDSIDNHISYWAGLKNDSNKIYAQVYPVQEGGTIPSAHFIDICRQNNINVCNTQIKSYEQLINYGFNHGETLLECCNITNIKSTVREYADSLIV